MACCQNVWLLLIIGTFRDVRNQNHPRPQRQAFSRVPLGRSGCGGRNEICAQAWPNAVCINDVCQCPTSHSIVETLDGPVCLRYGSCPLPIDDVAVSRTDTTATSRSVSTTSSPQFTSVSDTTTSVSTTTVATTTVTSTPTTTQTTPTTTTALRSPCPNPTQTPYINNATGLAEACHQTGRLKVKRTISCPTGYSCDLSPTSGSYICCSMPAYPRRKRETYIPCTMSAGCTGDSLSADFECIPLSPGSLQGICCPRRAYVCSQTPGFPPTGIGRYYFNRSSGLCEQILGSSASSTLSANTFATVEHCQSYCGAFGSFTQTMPSIPERMITSSSNMTTNSLIPPAPQDSYSHPCPAGLIAYQSPSNNNVQFCSNSATVCPAGFSCQWSLTMLQWICCSTSGPLASIETPTSPPPTMPPCKNDGPKVTMVVQTYSAWHYVDNTLRCLSGLLPYLFPGTTQVMSCTPSASVADTFGSCPRGFSCQRSTAPQLDMFICCAETSICPTFGQRTLVHPATNQIEPCSPLYPSCPTGYTCQTTLIGVYVCCSTTLAEFTTNSISARNRNERCPLGANIFIHPITNQPSTCNSAAADCPAFYKCVYNLYDRTSYCCSDDGAVSERYAQVLAQGGCPSGKPHVQTDQSGPTSCSPSSRVCPRGFTCLKSTLSDSWLCCDSNVVTSDYFRHCIWRKLPGKIEVTLTPGQESIETGKLLINGQIHCTTEEDCMQKCSNHQTCNHMIRLQSGETYFYHFDDDTPRQYVKSTLAGDNLVDSFDYLCDRNAAFPPEIRQYFRNMCNFNRSSCQPTNDARLSANNRKDLLLQLLGPYDSSMNAAFAVVRKVKQAIWEWIGVENMEILDDGLLNGDEILNVIQAQALLDFYLGETKRKRALIIDFQRRSNGEKWPTTTIKYKFDYSTGFLTNHTQIIKDTLTWFNTPATCFHFVEDQSALTDVIVFVLGKTGTGCAGTVGKQPAGKQNFVVMEDACLQTPGTLAHEVLHNLGLRHEHQRPDRNTYIDFLLANLDPTLLDTFQALIIDHNFLPDPNTNYYDTLYDYLSLMHYPERAGAKAGLPPNLYTIETVDTSMQRSIGQRRSLSPKDAAGLNRAYDCNQDCIYTEWGPWTTCSVSCGQGSSKRTRQVNKEASFAGRPCSRDTLVQRQECFLPGC